MFYRLTLNCNINDPQHIEAIKTGLKLLFKQSETINPGQVNAEPSFITIQKCYHDENPTIPCEVLEHVSTNGG